MISPRNGPVAYVLKRYPRLTETFIVNEIRAMERLGANLELFSILPPEPPPHHPVVREVVAPLHSLPPGAPAKVMVLARAHGAMIKGAPFRYIRAAGKAAVSSATSLSPIAVWKAFIRAAFVADTCQRRGVRHIHAHFAHGPTDVARFASLMSNIPFSFTAHAKDLYLAPGRLVRQRAKAAEFVATCTAYNERYLHAVLGPEAARKVERVYHGIDLPLLAFRPSTTAAAPDVDERLVLSVGRLVPKKGHDDLIAACALLRASRHRFRCMIVGEGPLRQDLATEIARRGLIDVVTLEGAMTHAELIDLYRHADLFALAPRIAENGDRDGIPNVIAEAMAIGVPVVSTEVSGIPELVRHERTGLLVPPRDPQALAGALARLLAAPDLAARLARDARALLELDFNLWETTRKLHALVGCQACNQVRTVAYGRGSRRIQAAQVVQ